MAEIQNTFIKSKMNKDLDDRLVPTGEYRNAQNISISRSEGSDVGALENILGNSKISVTDLGIPNLDVIGFLADNATNYIYLFLTCSYIESRITPAVLCLTFVMFIALRVYIKGSAIGMDPKDIEDMQVGM